MMMAINKINKQNLVGGDWNMTFIFPYIGNVIIPVDYYFSEGFKPPARNHLSSFIDCDEHHYKSAI